MKRLLILFAFCTSTLFAHASAGIWTQVHADAIPNKTEQAIRPDKFTVYRLDEQALRTQLFGLPEAPDKGIVIALPMPGGNYRQFKVWQEPCMEPGLAVKFPQIKTFTAKAIDNGAITAKLDFTVLGFHAMVLDGGETWFIDPFSNPGNGYYLCYNKKDIRRSAEHTCMQVDEAERALVDQQPIYTTPSGLPQQQLKQNGSVKHIYRLALACTGEYSVAVSGSSMPSVAISLSAMTTSLNRVNGVFEKEAGIHMNLIANNNLLIYTNSGLDPFSGNSSGPLLKAEIQQHLDTLTGVGPAAYDIGHIFSTGAGGIAELASVCEAGAKGQGVTGQPNPVGDAFDIDFVVHEMGHQFGATHTFNANTGSCGNNNLVANTAYEPGGGSTIMGYAGICGAGDNIAAHSDDYFHAASLDQMSDFINSSAQGGSCATTEPSGNVPSTVPSFATTHVIPYLTPFELTAPTATDADHDELSYNWEEWDRGDFYTSFDDVKKNGPIFRSFKQTASPTRIFPTLPRLLANQTRYLGEKLPEVERTLRFKLTVRDVLNGWGCFNTPGDMVTLNVVSSAGPFAVTFPSSDKDYLQSGSNATVTWNVANTTAAPVSCTNVDIMLSVDNGYTYPYILAANTANDGSEAVAVPANIYAAGCRVKVKAVGNVFFDISDYDFSIFPWETGIGNVGGHEGISVYPIPAKEILHVDVKNAGIYELAITNVMGQQVYKAQATAENTINTSGWAAGVYYVRLNDGSGKIMTTTVVKE